MKIGVVAGNDQVALKLMEIRLRKKYHLKQHCITVEGAAEEVKVDG